MRHAADNRFEIRLQPPDGCVPITSIDMHTGGEPLRVITGGLPAIDGSTVLEKRAFFRQHFDHLRTGLMLEPRGHADMYGAVLTPALDADFDVFFLHNEGYSTMCGHAIIALTKLVIEAGLAKGPEISFNVPAGRIRALGHIEGRSVTSASFRSVPSFVYRRDERLHVDGLGTVTFDVAYGGAFYAVVEAAQLGVRLDASDYARHITVGSDIKRAITRSMAIDHPVDPELSFLYGTIFTGPAHAAAHHSRNVCVFADGQVDRSATGSGVSARAALHHARGELNLDEKITIESILGSTMSVRAVERTHCGPYDAVIVEVGGSAHVIGRNEFWFDPADPLNRGFIFRSDTVGNGAGADQRTGQQ